MQTEKRAGRVMRNVAAVLVIILAIVALFQGFRMRGKEALFRNIAINKLGMVYAGEEQVKTYDDKSSDYVRQYSDVPTE